jgi:hypothetical protein
MDAGASVAWEADTTPVEVWELEEELPEPDVPELSRDANACPLFPMW